jgi:outer membrane protein OmpA-like peptidoglycan-associated protein
VPFGASTNLVDPGATPFLRQVAEQARASAARVRVVGHSPVASNASANDKLLAFSRASEQAETVAAELVRLGLPAEAVLIEAQSGAGAASGAEIFLEN